MRQARTPGWRLTAPALLSENPPAGATGDYFTDLASKGATAAAALTADGYDVCFVHIKAVDDAAHDRNTPLRILFLEAVDRMLAQVGHRRGSNP